MSFTKKHTEKKPVILCNVGDTLLFHAATPHEDEQPNTPLISFLNSAAKTGFEVRLYSKGVDIGSWGYDAILLREHGLCNAALENACSPRSLEPENFSNVVAIIDNTRAPYVEHLQLSSPHARYFKPNEVDALRAHCIRSVSQVRML